MLVTLAIQLPRLVASLAQPQPHQLLISALVHKQLLYRTPVQLCSSEQVYLYFSRHFYVVSMLVAIDSLGMIVRTLGEKISALPQN